MEQPHPLQSLNDNYIWVINHFNQSTFMCVDPGDATPVLDYAKATGLQLSHILLTHHHHDHIGGVAELLNMFPKIKIYAPNDSRIPQSTISTDGIISIENYRFEVLNTPGHTSSHRCYYEPTLKWLFCGDTLFSGGCGRVFDGTMLDLYQSILRLRDLPEDVQVYCGHEYTRQNLRFALTIEPDNEFLKNYLITLQKNKTKLSLPSNIAIEKKLNPFMRTDTRSIQNYAIKNGLNPADLFVIFTHIRNKKDLFN